VETRAIPVGTEVVDIEGERLGNVIAAAADYIVAEHGLFFPTDYYIPLVAIAEVTEATVRLTVTKEDALNQGWGVQPDETTSTSAQPPERKGS
jgi:hypothetical protein